MTRANLQAAIQAIELAIGAANVSHDVTGYTIDGRRPGVVVSPDDLPGLSKVMSVAYQRGLAVAPWGGGTRSELGNPIRSLDVVVDLSNLRRVVRHNAADLTATVEAGISMASFRR